MRKNGYPWLTEGVMSHGICVWEKFVRTGVVEELCLRCDGLM